MKVVVLVVVVLLAGLQSTFAQNENASLLVQSPYGHIVKMIWFLKSWDKEITGFDIKRKEGLQKEWVKLNKEAIYPEISLNKNLNIVESDKSEALRIKSVLIDYIAHKKLSEIDKNALASKFAGDNNFLQSFFQTIFEDYDIALISGFGFVDRTATRKIDYEYGLFVHGTEKMLAVAKWNYGQFPDLDLITDITSKSILKKRGIQLMWNADVNKIKAAYVHGFNVYRDGIRLNSEPIFVGYNKNQSEFLWYDSSANSNESIQYSIGSESVLDIEGIVKPYTYNPSEHADEYKSPEISGVMSLGYYFKDGIKISWNLPRDYDRFIKGYYVEKDNLPNGYKRVSPLIEPQVRDFIDNSASPVSSYVRFRLITLYKDQTTVTSNDYVYSYFPITEPPPPFNVHGNCQFSNNVYKVNLSWNPPMKGDTLTEKYSLFVMKGSDSKFSLDTNAKFITGNKYSYLIDSGVASKYSFFIRGVTSTNTESANSDTFTALVPSITLPPAENLKNFLNDNKVLLKWQYPEISDLKGFRIFENNKLIADENEINRDKREYTTKPLKGETTYNYTIQAITTNNVVGAISPLTSLTTPYFSKRR